MDELLRHNDMPFGGDDDSAGERALRTLKEKTQAIADRVKTCAVAAKENVYSVGHKAKETACAACVKTRDTALTAGTKAKETVYIAGVKAKESARAVGVKTKEFAAVAAPKAKETVFALCVQAKESACAAGVKAKETAVAAAPKAKAAVARHPVSPMLYAAVLALGVGVGVFRSTYVSAYAVCVDGVEVGLVSDTNEVELALSNVERQVATVLGATYDYDAQVTYTPVYSTADEITDSQSIEDYLMENCDALMDGYVLTVGGQEMGVGATEEDLQALLDRVAAPYLTDDTVDYGFVEEVSISASQMSSDTQFDLDAIYDALTAQTVEEAYYTVVQGDTFVKIAKSLDMTMDELSALNPDVTPSKLSVGQQLVIQQSVPFLSVYTTDTETYEETIASPVEYTETDTLYVGETKVTVQGEDGLAQITADVTYVNGYETERTVTDTVTVVEATTTQTLKGTKEKPKTASTGTYKYPVSGYTVTSRYGYRSGEFHTGVDLAVPYGTAVKAADGGTVTFAGRQGNYGNLVIITHDNGTQTYYAHNSSLLVSTGDKVYQGQQIAKAGSTGRSTGNHCHFEIRINGSTVNPFNYLK